MAGTTGTILTCPLEVVKTRFQASQYKTNLYNTNYNPNNCKHFVSLNYCKIAKSLLFSAQTKENQTLNTNQRFYGATPKLTNSTSCNVNVQNTCANFLLRNNSHLTHMSHGTHGSNGVIANSFSFELNHNHTISNNRQNFLLNAEAMTATRPRVGSLILLSFRYLIL